jgi:hypothetical protein
MAPSWHPNEALTFIFKNACGTTTCWGSLVSQCFPSRLRSMGDQWRIQQMEVRFIRTILVWPYFGDEITINH